ncbi:DUF6138 family protein [Lysinibacillus sp. FSL K6-1151]|uniref:DUF6138 family protein n=1 Tax=Lysinibacillus sp. FSL K6-1151 TaxID=2921465 RepID=UPI00315A0564
MQQCVEHFLAAVWEQLTAVYQQESKRIMDLKEQSKLQAGVFHYLKVAWKKGKSPNGNIFIDVYEPFSWSDSAYRVEAGPYIQEFTKVNQIEELFSALCTKMETLFQSEQYGFRFFDYHFQVVLEFEHDGTMLSYQKKLLHDHKLALVKEQLATFIETKVMAELPIRPSDHDEFFFAQYLVNPHFFHQSASEIEPLICQLEVKHCANKERLDQWVYYYTMAFKHWAEKYFLPYYFEQTGDYIQEWVLKTEDMAQQLEQEKLNFFLYVALKIGQKEPATRLEYLELAKQLGSQQAVDYLQKGSGRFESMRKREMFQGQANDVLQTIDIRVIVEEEAAYREALHYIIQLLQEGFPKGYKLTFKSKVKNYLPVKKLAKSKLHQFFANCLEYPSLFPLVANYAQIAMEEFAWYQDVEPSEKSAMPGTYAVFGLGLYSKAYFPLVEHYMALVDTEHQSVQDAYAEAFQEVHGLAVEVMPVFVAILLGGSESAKPLKGMDIKGLDLLTALVQELEKKEDYQRAFILYRIFGSSKKIAQRLKQEEAPMKNELQKLLQWMDL